MIKCDQQGFCLFDFEDVCFEILLAYVRLTLDIREVYDSIMISRKVSFHRLILANRDILTLDEYLFYKHCNTTSLSQQTNSCNCRFKFISATAHNLI